MGRQLAVAVSSMFAWVAGAATAAEQAPAVEAADATGAARNAMVARQIEARGVRSPAVLQAMRAVPRHEFVPEAQRARAYQDSPLPIGEGQTISQPYIVALMTELAAPRKGARVLEIGTGSGYQAAVLAELAARVYSVEVVEDLAWTAAERLRRLGYESVEVRHGDGAEGWPEHAPYDRIVVTAAAPRLPPALLEQVRPGGRIVAPIGLPLELQILTVFTRTAEGIEESPVLPVAFVPLVGPKAGFRGRRFTGR
jgi:protein-L-isoaspartate(D-aspartate) O-methyltransferase